MCTVRKFGAAGTFRAERTARRAGERRPGTRYRAIGGAVGAAALGFLLHAAPAPAIEISEGELQGSLDTTLSHGLTFRVGERQSRADDYRSANSNDGNLNYDRGLVSNTSKLTTELDLGYREFGAFVRATGFIDFENRDGERDRTALSDAARDLVGRDFDVLDAYVTGAFDAGGTPIDVRLGRHVLNWGESTFITNGINAFNRFDVSRLRLPGSELREALAPASMISVSAAPTDNLSVEGFYQLDWEETVIDPAGSYFSTTDYVGAGAREAVINDPQFGPLLDPFGGNLDRGFTFGALTRAINADLQSYTVLHPQFGAVPQPQPLQLEFDSEFMTVVRGPDREPGDSGQWGMALRYLAENLNQTEFGLHFGSYHSRLPVLGARTSNAPAIQAGLAAAGAVGAMDSHTVGAVSEDLSAKALPAVTEAVTAQVMAALQAGQLGPVDPSDVPALIEMQVREQVAGLVGPGVKQYVGGIAATLALDRYADPTYGGGHYFIEYPEDVRFLGLSFNTVLGASGWALQGEYTLHLDAPLQRAERTIIKAGIWPMLEALGLAAANPAGIPGYLASYQPGKVTGYIRHDVSQVQATATRVFGPALGADALVFVTEAAMMQVHDLADDPDKPLESPARKRRLDDDDATADADATSWGYRVAARLDYNNAIGAVNLYPYLQWGHDVSGNSPSPSGPFAEGRTSLTLGVRADYLSRWEANVSFTTYGGLRNTLYDRDFVSASIKYSF